MKKTEVQGTESFAQGPMELGMVGLEPRQCGLKLRLFTMTSGSPWRLQLGPMPTTPQQIHEQKHHFPRKKTGCPLRLPERYPNLREHWAPHILSVL